MAWREQVLPVHHWEINQAPKPFHNRHSKICKGVFLRSDLGLDLALSELLFASKAVSVEDTQ